MGRFVEWLGSRFGGRKVEEQVEREIAFHVETLTESYVARGVPAREARRRAMVEFGGREQVKQQVREVHTSALVESAKFNVRSAVRFVRRAPSFAFAVICDAGSGDRCEQRRVFSGGLDFAAGAAVSAWG